MSELPVNESRREDSRRREAVLLAQKREIRTLLKAALRTLEEGST
jgi:hypothetical protein